MSVLTMSFGSKSFGLGRFETFFGLGFVERSKIGVGRNGWVGLVVVGLCFVHGIVGVDGGVCNWIVSLDI